MVQSFLATAKDSSRSLGSLKEFRYARSQINSSEKGIFIYLSDPFFRNLVGPAYRVEMTRRAQSTSEMQMLSLTRLAAIQEGERSLSVTSLIEKGFLPDGFGIRHDETQLILEEDGTVTDSIRGVLGSFLPIPDMTIDKITSAEEEAYKVFADAYSGLWTNMDPVFGLLRNERKSSGEQLELKLNISPYAKSRYGDLDNFLAKPTHGRIAMVSGDLVSLEAILTKDLIMSPLPLHIFCGLRDMNIPWAIRHGAATDWDNLLRHADSFLRLYIGITIPSNFDEKYFLSSLGLRTEPDANGYAKLSSRWIGIDDVWSRRFSSFNIIGTGRSLLETVSPNIRIIKADYPSQISLNIGDLSESQLGNALRAEAYAKDRCTSAGNALLLHAYQQQLQPDNLYDAIKAIQNLSLTCPLGGTFVPDEEQHGRWKSTAWAEETLYHTNYLPDTYRHTVIDELKSMRLEFSIDPDTLKTRLEVETK
jgi:hypothetical protein